MKKLILATLISTTLVSGCSKEATVGEVDGRDITRSAFDGYLEFKNIPAEDQRAARALDAYLERTALADAIIKTDALDQKRIDAEVEELRKQMIISRYFEQHLNNAVSDEAIRNYYSSHADDYQSRKVKVSHILLRVTPDMAESERQAILTTAHEAYSKLQSGESFETVAKAYSQDKISAAKGGELGWINEGAVSPEFSEKAFSMSEGGITEPFLTSFGFHILKVNEEPQVVKKPLEAVKGDIRYMLRNAAKQAETERLLESIEYSKEG